jgi:hypothetical protein
VIARGSLAREDLVEQAVHLVIFKHSDGSVLPSLSKPPGAILGKRGRVASIFSSQSDRGKVRAMV